MLNQKHLKNTGDFLVILIGFPIRFTFYRGLKNFLKKHLTKGKYFGIMITENKRGERR